MLRQLRMPAVVLASLMIAGAAGMIGCKGMGGHDDSSTSSKSLYERLGGHDAIVAVVDDFVGRAASDPKVNFFRKNPGPNGPHANVWNPSPEELATFKKHLVQFVEQAAGGPKNYQGKDMVTTHKGMDITDEEFNAIAADLKATLDKFKVPAKEQGELLGAVGGTRSQIVGK